MTLAAFPTAQRRPAPPELTKITANYKMPDFGQPWPDAITYLPNGWGVSISVIRPILAEQMLAFNSDQQRRKKRRTIYQFGRDMIEGRWQLTHQGIAFNRQGELVDGQNRLTACVEAGVPFTSLVYFGVGDAAEMVVFDTGIARTAVDSAKVAGVERADNRRVAILRAFLYGIDPTRTPMTNSFILEQLSEYAPMLDYVCGLPQTSQLLGTGVRAALGRAYYHLPFESVQRFVRILLDQEVPSRPGDRSAVTLRTSQLNRTWDKVGKNNRDQFCRALRAIRGYAEGDDLDRLYPESKDVYPLPSELQMQLAGK